MDLHLFHRLTSIARHWQVSLDETWESPGAILAFGKRRRTPVVLKVNRHEGDEWHAGEVLDAFQGQGTVRVYEYEPGAILLERLEPGTQLVELVRLGKDAVATEILGQVMRQMAHHVAPDRCRMVRDWGRGFDSYLGTSDKQISAALVSEARDLYQTLAVTERAAMLLHGDLQHYNVLFDSNRGWLAIDPKGIVG